MKRCVVLLVAWAAVFGAMSSDSVAGEWRIPIGLSYVSGFEDAVDLYEANLRAEGYYVDTVEAVPVGLSVYPYYEWDSGVGIGANMGPGMMIIGDADLFILPLGLDVRWALPSKFSISPYLRGGIRYPVANGDYVEDSKLGFFGGAGAVFMRDRTVGFGFEIAVDTSAVEFEVVGRRGSSGTTEIEPAELTVSIFAVL